MQTERMAEGKEADAPGVADERHSESSQSLSCREVIGFVTSAAPRGVQSLRGSIGVCLASPLWLQHVARKHGDPCRSAIVGFQNHASSTMRLAEARICWRICD